MRACSSGVSGGMSRVSSSAGIAERLGAERVEPRGEVPVHPVRLDERHRRGDAAEQRLVDLARRAARVGAARRSAAPPAPLGGGRRVAVAARRASRAAAQAGMQATESLSPLSKSARHSAGTASGFSR